MGQYAIVKSKKWKTAGRLPLPLSLGTAPDNNVIINSKSAAPVLRFVVSNGPSLSFIDPIRSERTSDGSMKAYGVKLSGPYPDRALKLSRIRRFLVELMCDEARLFAKLPYSLQQAFGGYLVQPVRLLVWSVLAFSLFAITASHLKSSEEEIIDRSEIVYSVDYATYYPGKIGASPTYKDFSKGITFRYLIPEEKRQKDHVLAFEMRDGDIDAEISVIVNGQNLMSTELLKECLTDFCPYQVLVPSALIAKGEAVVFFQHHYPDSDYAFDHIIFEPTRQIRVDEQKTVERWMASAQRYFVERFVAHENLLKARQDAKRVLDFVKTKQGVDDIRSRAESLLKEIRLSIDKQIKDRWFEAHQNMHLGKYIEARNDLLALKAFLAGTTDERQRQVGTMLDEVEGFLK